jgi:cytochrome b involved in lipid metabolism
MALFTFGEGYHNYHHEFQHDYRNGVRPWQWDPTKWIIWTLSKLKLTAGLRRVPEETIAAALERSRQETETGENQSDVWAVLPLVFPTPAQQPAEAHRVKTRL